MQPDPSSLFAALVSEDGGAIDLAEAALLIAQEEYPDLEARPYLERLDQWGASVRERLPEHPTPTEAATRCAPCCSTRRGCAGLDDYYDPRNSFLNEVLDRRTGIPITRRYAGGRPARGPPGGGPGPARPLHRRAGRAAGPVLRRRVAVRGAVPGAAGPRVRQEGAPDAGMLAACDTKTILARMLRNLKLIYGKRATTTCVPCAPATGYGPDPWAPSSGATGPWCTLRSAAMPVPRTTSRSTPGCCRRRTTPRSCLPAPPPCDNRPRAQLTPREQDYEHQCRRSERRLHPRHRGRVGRGPGPLLDHKCLGIPRESLYLLGPTSSTASTRRATCVCAATSSTCSTAAPGGHRLRVDPAGGPGHRALGRRPSRRTSRTSTPSRS